MKDVKDDYVSEVDNIHYVQSLIDETQQYKRILEFYANEKNYSHKSKFTIDEYIGLSKVVKDNGRQAREILNKFK